MPGFLRTTPFMRAPGPFIYSAARKKVRLTLSTDDVGVRFEARDVAARALRSLGIAASSSMRANHAPPAVGRDCPPLIPPGSVGFAFLLASLVGAAAAQTITTVAGTGAPGSSATAAPRRARGCHATDARHDLLASVTATAGVVCLSAAVQGWWRRALRPWERLLLFAAALLLIIKPGWITDLIGLVLAGLALLSQSRRASSG